MPEENFLKQAAPGLNAKASCDTFTRRDITNSSARQTTAEVRSSPRHPVSLAAEVFEPLSRTRLACRATDISMGGCYLDMFNPLAAGTDVHLRLVSEGLAFQAEGRVLYSTPGMGMGLAFTRMIPTHLEVLSGWMRALGPETVPVPVPLPPDETGFDFEAQTKPVVAAGNLRVIVTELVTLLARKQVLTDGEAEELQKQLFRRDG